VQTSTLDDDANLVDDMKARRIHSVLEQIRSRGLHDVDNDRRSVLDELHSFANTVNGLELPRAPATTSSHHDRHPQSYSDRLAQTRGDLKLLEQLVGQTFHWQPQQPSEYDATRADVSVQTHQQPVILHSLLFINPVLQLSLYRRTKVPSVRKRNMGTQGQQIIMSLKR